MSDVSVTVEFRDGRVKRLELADQAAIDGAVLFVTDWLTEAFQAALPAEHETVEAPG